MAKKGEQVQCVVCGALYTATRNGPALYCENCRAKVKREQQRAWRDKPKENRVVEKPKYTLAEVSLAARKCNMSYGQYVAQWKLGRVPGPEKLTPQKKRGRPCKST